MTERIDGHKVSKLTHFIFWIAVSFGFAAAMFFFISSIFVASQQAWFSTISMVANNLWSGFLQTEFDLGWWCWIYFADWVVLITKYPVNFTNGFIGYLILVVVMTIVYWAEGHKRFEPSDWLKVLGFFAVGFGWFFILAVEITIGVITNSGTILFQPVVNLVPIAILNFILLVAIPCSLITLTPEDDKAK